ncbi:MAG: hypothetical protein PGN11_02730 [Quadrisphaera sp.]
MPAPQTAPWWEVVHGDPCRECGTPWVVPFERALDDVRAVPDRLALLVADTPTDARCPDLAWPAVEYAVHVADSLRTWSERLGGALAGDAACASGADLAALVQVRRYDSYGWGAALWSVRRSAQEWCDVVREAHRRGVVVRHPQRGPLTAEDVALRVRHSALHHLWDVSRTVAVTASTC